MTPGQHLPPEYEKGDETTVGGYAAVHSRPAALEGRDGMSYSLDVLSDTTDDAARPVGAYLIFVQWSRLGAQRAEGHLETGFLARGRSSAEAEAVVRAMSLADAQLQLNALIHARDGETTRRWWDAMREDDGSA